MDQLVNGVGLPLLVSIFISVGGQYIQSQKDADVLKENVVATKALTEAVIELKTNMAVVLDRQERGNGR